MQNIEVDVRLAFTTSNRAPFKYVEIQVTDIVSGKRVMDIPLSVDQFYSIMSGAGTYGLGVHAEALRPEDYAHVGKQCVTFSRRFKDVSDREYGTKAGQRAVWLLWAEAMREAMNCHTVNWSDHNNGVSVTFHRFENDMSTQEIDRLDAFLEGATPPDGLRGVERASLPKARFKRA